MALHHLAMHLWQPTLQEGQQAAALDEMRMRRLRQMVKGAVTAAELLDPGPAANGSKVSPTLLCLLGYPSLVTTGPREDVTMRAAVARLVAWTRDVEAGRSSLDLQGKARAAIDALVAEEQEWEARLREVCPQALVK